MFDSGGVLIQPIGGRWNPRADFEDVLHAHAPHLTPDQLETAIAEGLRFLNSSVTTPDYDDFHRAILTALGVEATRKLLDELSRPVPMNEVVEVFPEVVGVLEELRRRGVRMGVVSDTWAGLDRAYDVLGIGEFFEVYAISQELGYNKPDPRMYRHASDAFGLDPQECLFVDDVERLVAAAIDLGYVGRVITRGSPEHPPAVAAISSLVELLDLF